jgi:hypothetical protein
MNPVIPGLTRIEPQTGNGVPLYAKSTFITLSIPAPIPPPVTWNSYNAAAIALKQLNSVSRFCMISFASSSGFRKLSRSAKLLSFNQKIFMLIFIARDNLRSGDTTDEHVDRQILFSSFVGAGLSCKRTGGSTLNQTAAYKAHLSRYRYRLA